jgi:chorismate mutase
MMNTGDPVSEFRDLQDSIDAADAAIILLLAERFRCSAAAIGRLKTVYGLPFRDPGRHAAQISRLRHPPAQSRLDPDFAEKFHSLSNSGKAISHIDSSIAAGPPGAQIAVPSLQHIRGPW